MALRRPTRMRLVMARVSSRGSSDGLRARSEAASLAAPSSVVGVFTVYRYAGRPGHPALSCTLSLCPSYVGCCAHILITFARSFPAARSPRYIALLSLTYPIAIRTPTSVPYSLIFVHQCDPSWQSSYSADKLRFRIFAFEHSVLGRTIHLLVYLTSYSLASCRRTRSSCAFIALVHRIGASVEFTCHSAMHMHKLLTRSLLVVARDGC